MNKDMNASSVRSVAGSARHGTTATSHPLPSNSEIRETNMETDYEAIHLSLIMRANWIETRDPNMSARDAINSGKTNRLKALSHEQEELVRRLRTLAAGFLR